jgi:hypothetical protein
MMSAVQSVLEAFERLTDDEQRQVVREILVRTRDVVEVPPLDYETIDRIADESFLEYNAREAAGAER